MYVCPYAVNPEAVLQQMNALQPPPPQSPVATPIPLASPPPPAYCSYSPGVWFSGGDVAQIAASGAGECCSACGNDTAGHCMAWTFFLGGLCFLKGSSGWTAVNSSNYVSGTLMSP